MSAHPREHLAWLIWCMNQGYVKVADRAGMDNWLLEDPATLHASDAELRPHLLAMADEVLRQIDGSGVAEMKAEDARIRSQFDD